MDTRTPLYAVGAGNLLNAVLDALLIFPIGLGVSGAALATVTSEYLTAFILLWKLNNEVDLFSWNIIEDGGVIRYLKSGGLLIGRTIAVFLTLTLSTSLATREGPIPMVGYEICLQLWLTISLLNDALALAGQALLASEYAKGNYKPARVVLYKVLQVGGVIGFLLAASLFVGFGSLSLLFTDDPAVLDVAHSRAWFVTISQPIAAAVQPPARDTRRPLHQCAKTSSSYLPTSNPNPKPPRERATKQNKQPPPDTATLRPHRHSHSSAKLVHGLPHRGHDEGLYRARATMTAVFKSIFGWDPTSLHTSLAMALMYNMSLVASSHPIDPTRARPNSTRPPPLFSVA
uniref:Protein DETOXIFICATION n=1 Tax=Zea mays TaxID=4577 RepID=A0A804PRB9_MAIZE